MRGLPGARQATRKDAYPLLRMHDLLDHPARAVIFSKLDLHSGYWQIPIMPEDMLRTAFLDALRAFRFQGNAVWSEPAADGAAQGRRCAAELLCVHAHDPGYPACALPAAPGSRSSSARLARLMRAGREPAGQPEQPAAVAGVPGGRGPAAARLGRARGLQVPGAAAPGLHACIKVSVLRKGVCGKAASTCVASAAHVKLAVPLITKLLRGDKWLCEHAVTERMR